MDLRISPRSRNDRGGVACMPLRRNVPEGRTGWKLTTCPNCGRECWEIPMLAVAKAQGGFCTVYRVCIETGHRENYREEYGSVCCVSGKERKHHKHEK